MSEKTYYRPGLIFKSKTSAHQEMCRSYKPVRAVDGTVIDEYRELLAEFATHGNEYNYTRPDGTIDVAADIKGHFFVLDLQAEEKGWTADEKEIVARHMLRMCERHPGGDFGLYTKAPLAAPWPRYDEAPYSKIAELAEQFGCVAEALAYEAENKNRPSVIKDLGIALERAAAEENLVAA